MIVKGGGGPLGLPPLLTTSNPPEKSDGSGESIPTKRARSGRLIHAPASSPRAILRPDCNNPSVGLVSVADRYQVRWLCDPYSSASTRARPSSCSRGESRREVVIGLGTAEGPVKLVKVHGMKDKDIVRAVRLVTIWKAHLLATWKTIHGE
jgi:hypothetical protein